MRQISRLLVGLTLTFMAVLPMYAQQENTAFYIYQNDGHFDGFFYDEVEKISYSVLDTLGIEHDEIVSQEIVTADSTYRIMLSAIDSVGFVQPEMKYNPRLHILSRNWYADSESSYYYSDEATGYTMITTEFDRANSTFTYDLMHVYGDKLPQVGDVFLYTGMERGDVDNGFCLRVVELEDKNYTMVAHCEPSTDITDIIHQFVGLERYDHDRQGRLIRRRVAGRPDLTVGEFPRRASEGTWEGDVFDFSISNHIPLYATDDLNITIDPALSGSVHLKTAWNMSWLGDKYLAITTLLDFGVGMGFTVDGKIKDFFPTGFGKMASIPVPATCPLFVIDLVPDAFIRGDAHVKLSTATPTLKGAMWAKLEFNNWVPWLTLGFGRPDGNDAKFERFGSGSDLALELNGFVQAGMSFPLKFGSLPCLSKIVAADIGGSVYVGPKLAGAVSLDLAGMELNGILPYRLLKGTQLSLHVVDADFEVTGTVDTWLTGKKKVTLADGGMNLFPPIDVALAPEFGDCESKMGEQEFKQPANDWSSSFEKYEGTMQACREFTFKPDGNVLSPTVIGVAMLKVEKDGSETLLKTQTNPNSYYQLHKILGQELPEHFYAKFTLWYINNWIDNWSWEGSAPNGMHYGTYRVRPIVAMMGRTFLAEPAYDFSEDPEFKMGDVLGVKYDGTPLSPIGIINTNATSFNSSWALDSCITITDKGSNNFELSLNKQKFNYTYGKNYSFKPITIETGCYGYRKVGEIKFNTSQPYKIVLQPTEEAPSHGILVMDGSGSYELGASFSSFSAVKDGDKWHISASTGTPSSDGASISFDLVEDTSEDYNTWQQHFENKGRSIRYKIVNGSFVISYMWSSDYIDSRYKYEGTFGSGDNEYIYLYPPTGEFGRGYCTGQAKRYSAEGSTKSDCSFYISGIKFAKNFRNSQ